MTSNPPRKHHTVTAGYVRRFATDTGTGNTVTVHHRNKGVYDEGPRGVGYQFDYWGPPDLARQVEAMFMGTESDALALLRDLQARWPLTRDDRATLGQFVAIHIVRTPSFAGWLRQLGAKTAGEVLAEEDRLDEEQMAQMEEMFRGDRMHARTLLRQVPRIGSVLCSMHWSVVEFHEDWLISSDQPVVLLPPPPYSISPDSVIPPHGVMGALEGRFTLDPRRALVLSWREEQDEPWLNGTHPHACSINCALKAQALTEWFCLPGTRPPFISPLCFRSGCSPSRGTRRSKS